MAGKRAKVRQRLKMLGKMMKKFDIKDKKQLGKIVRDKKTGGARTTKKIKGDSIR